MNCEPEPHGAPTVEEEGRAETSSDMAGHTGGLGSGVWILGAWRDSLLILGTPVILVLALVVLLRWAPVLDEGLILALAAFLAIGHHSAGFLRVYGDRDLRRAWRTRLLGAPLVFLAVAGTFAVLRLEAITVVLALWVFWHVTTQAYGFVRIYDAKVGSFSRWTARLDFLMCFCWLGLGFLLSAGRIEQLFRDFHSAGGPLIPELWLIGLQLVWVVATVLVTLAFLANYLQQRRQGQPASLLKLLTMAGGIGLWWYTMVIIPQFLLGLLFFEIYHVVQYLGIVWAFGLGRAECGGDLARPAKFVFRRRRLSALLYVALVAAYGLPVLLLTYYQQAIPPQGAGELLVRLFFGLVVASMLTHFYLEGFIWRIRERLVRTAFRLADAGPETSPPQWLPAGLAHGLKWAVLLISFGLLGAMDWKAPGPTEGMHEHLAEVVPKSWLAHARCGELLLEMGRLAEADAELDTALELYPNNPRVLCVSGEVKLQRGDVEGAISQFEAAITVHPRMAHGYSGLGKSLFSAGEFDRGLTQLRRAGELDPGDPRIHYEIGLAEYGMVESSDPEQRDFSVPLAAFDEAVELDPSFAMALNARGRVLWNMGRLDEALEDLTEAIRIDPKFARAYRNRAGVRMSKVQPEEAIEDLTQAIELDRTQSRDFVIRGDMYTSIRDFEKALKDYEEAVNIENQALVPVERLVQTLTSCPDEKFRDVPRAIQVAHAACRHTEWQSVAAIQLLAVCHAMAGEFDEAIAFQNKAIELAPDDQKQPLKVIVGEFEQAKQNAAQAATKDTSSDPQQPAGAGNEEKPPL